MRDKQRIVVVIPCYNEEQTIGKVVKDFKRVLPESEIYVMDNRSTDKSAELAEMAGACVMWVGRKGKGSVVREIFRKIEADIYVMIDGDDTYPTEVVCELVKPIADGAAEMVVGDRLSKGFYAAQNKRNFHNFGNLLVKKLVNFCFKSNLKDIMSGYRVFSKLFAKNIPILSDGFEVETEMTIRCLDRKLGIVEIPVEYRDRPAGSFSKLNTIKDGFRVLKTIFVILKDYRPLFFFGSISLLLFIFGLISGTPVLLEFLKTRYVSHVPLSILATGLMLTSGLSLACGFILDTLVAHERQRNEVDLLKTRRIKE